ncbi:MAG TPA: VWA domain-containing protein [Bryobacteraceae bacterium]|jgi:Ca-activated chloride channel family protein|nr:VWA domain-containing protein [Bryobacteraceae bacterium]
MQAGGVRQLRLALPLAVCLAMQVQFGQAQFKPADPAQQSRPPLQPLPQKGPGDTPTFAIKVNLVRVLVTVRDSNGALLANLTKEDFAIEDSGTPQEIAVFEQNTSYPLSVAVLMDTSASVQNDLHYEAESVLNFIPALLGSGNPEDTFAIFTFNWRTSLESDFSRSKKRAERVLHGLRGEGGTSLYDAVYLASDALTGREGRHVLVVVTDGGDTTSYKHYGEALAAAQRADVVLYPIVVIPIAGDVGRNMGGEHALATLASSTGGRIFYPQGFDRLNQAFADIIRELRTQYLLGFYPQEVREEPRRYHPVTVKVKNAALRVTARDGYYEP